MSNGTTSLQFQYDSDGIRTQKTVNGITTQYTTLDGRITGQSNGTTTLYFRYDENGTPFGFSKYSVDGGSEHYLYITNQQGDVVAIVNESGDIVGTYTYDAWGNLTTDALTEVAELNPIRYRGYYQDTETGLYYLQSRYYDPTTMRFINADDPNIIQMGSTEKQELNLYAYCVNDPVNCVDPTGYWTIASEANRLINVLFASIMALKLSGAALIAKVSAMILAVAPYLFVVVAVVAVSVATYYLAKKIALDKAIAKVKNTVKRNSKNRYWTATIQSGYVSVGRPLTYSQAVKEVVSKRNVFAVTSYEAKAVARAAGGNSGNNNKPLYPEIHGKSSLGYYWHYHIYNRKGGHVFYLFG